MSESSDTTLHRRYRELAFRESDGVSVRLFWDSLEDEVFVRVRDQRNADDFVLSPPRHEALSAFHHPYASADRIVGTKRCAGSMSPRRAGSPSRPTSQPEV